MPQLTTLRRIAAVLDEELLLCFQRIEDGELERAFAAVMASRPALANVPAIPKRHRFAVASERG